MTQEIPCSIVAVRIDAREIGICAIAGAAADYLIGATKATNVI